MSCGCASLADVHEWKEQMVGHTMSSTRLHIAHLLHQGRQFVQGGFIPHAFLSHCRMWPYIGATSRLMIGMRIQKDTTQAPPSGSRAPGSFNSRQSHHSEGHSFLA